MFLSLLLFFAATVWSAKVEDFENTRTYYSKYLFFDEKMYQVIRTSLNSHGVYLCAQEFLSTNRPDNENLDFEKLAKTYARCYFEANIFHTSKYVDWIELYGNKEELKRPEFSDLRVNLKIKDVKFSNKDSIPDKVELSLRNFIDNSHSDMEASLKVEHKLERITSATVESSHSISHSASLEVGVSDPITDSGASLKVSIFGSASSGTSNTNSTKVTYTVTDVNTVSDHKIGRLIWTKAEKDVKMEWSAYIEASGWIAIQNTILYDTDLHFIPVSDMAYVFNDYVTRLDVNTVGIKVSGILEMKDAVISDAVVDEYSVSRGGITCPKEFSNITSKSMIS